MADAAFPAELCVSRAEPPEGDDWLHEVKWDGYRILATVVERKVRLWSRNAIEWTAKAPELVEAVASLGLVSAQLDGEMIVLAGGRDDFNALQRRLSAETRAPLVYMLFDLLHANGVSLRGVPLLDRKAALAALLQRHPHERLRYSEHRIGGGRSMFAQATAGGLEGVVSKRIASAYRGSRNGDWVKAKGRPSDEFIVIGYTEPKGRRSGIGALLLARPGVDGLHYAGRVGTGFDDALLRALRRRLAPTVVAEPPGDIALMERRDVALAIWVEPRLVVEAYFQGIGGQGLLRQPAFKTLREDKTAASLIREARNAAARSVAVAKAPPPLPPGPQPRAARSTKSAARTAGDAVEISNPEREVFPGTGIRKGDVADYYRAVAPLLLAGVAGRPLSVVRCPDGTGQACFFQKHAGSGWGRHVRGVPIEEKSGRSAYLCIDDPIGLLELVQMNVLEFHPWGATARRPEHADRVVFDLDPHPSVAWPRMRAAARELRDRLASIGLRSFLRTSGGKGLHVVVPLDPPAPWHEVKAFAQAVARAMAELRPGEFVSVAGEGKRKDRIFVDWLRNGHGATSVASYSLRARAAAGVAMPIEWHELDRVRGGDAWTIRNALQKIRRRARDPWAEIDTLRQRLPAFD